MNIETKDYIYDVAINVAQIEITGKCNMHCLHCRDKGADKKDMPLWAIKKVIDFALKNSDGLLEIVLSGGEPLLHPDLEEILQYCSERKVSIEITTNGSLITEKHIDLFKRYNVTNVSVSLDSAKAALHNYIRQCDFAYEKAIEAIKLMLHHGINARIRATISKNNVDDLDELVLLAINLGVNCLAIGPVMPIGNAQNMIEELFSTKEDMKQFIEKFYSLKNFYANQIDLITNECLHHLVIKENDTANTDEFTLNGCTAGVVTFNVLLNGDVTPCSMFHKKITNIFECDDLESAYINSTLIKQLLDRDYQGKCGMCTKKYECGGCRARAEFFCGNYLDEDPLCWI